VNSICKDLLDGYLFKISSTAIFNCLVSYFIFFSGFPEMTYIVSGGALNSILTHSLLVFNHDFVIYIDSTHIAASNTATDVVTN